MPDPWQQAAADIRAASPDTVLYTGGGLAKPTELRVIWTDAPGDPFQGPGNTTRTITAEIACADLPNRPIRSDRLARGGLTWQPNQVSYDDNVDAWLIVLEKVA
ncbi:hypothetical protein CA233_19190 [Sphingomonas sp. ABOLD]|uniref:Uncharacterized protein n=1 Tax=Sphingomonas trueperi TaxID=53317 RepID=A0A7X5Y2I3_9SPHN|nr:MULTISPECIES: hypothetical protein [Sphingomonas]NJB99430.1 hypothetical protein [Sphingomonas trueperi]RSV35184.1 hypothetical protein CA234_20340 [Sphingomonas sp. ABOLE]RSV40965.1 hypothetical protein CA233_19190 [Sphingomonas sp. ABOLD]